jgi:Mannosyltransferase (PIG-V)
MLPFFLSARLHVRHPCKNDGLARQNSVILLANRMTGPDLWIYNMNYQEKTWTTPTNQHFARLKQVFKRYQFPLQLAIYLRIGMSLWFAFIALVIDPYFPRDTDILEGAYHYIMIHSTFLGKALLDIWLRYDAIHYMNIAKVGYAALDPGDLNFPPLYPYLTRLLSFFTFGEETLAGLLVSTMAMIFAFILLYELVLHRFEDPDLAREAILVLGIYPTSFFFFGPYTEALFLLLTVAFFISLERRRWILAGLCTALASVARLQGLILVLPLLFAIYRSHSYRSLEAISRPLLGLAIAPLGFAAFYFWRVNQNLASMTASFQEFSKIVFVDPLTGVYLAGKQFLSTGNLLVLAELLSALFFCGLIIWMLFQPRFRKQYDLMIYSVGLMLVFLSKHGFDANPMPSMNRYVLSIFPAFIALAFLLVKSPPWSIKIYRLVSVFLLLLSSVLYGLWFFIG